MRYFIGFLLAMSASLFFARFTLAAVSFFTHVSNGNTVQCSDNGTGDISSSFPPHQTTATHGGVRPGVGRPAKHKKDTATLAEQQYLKLQSENMQLQSDNEKLKLENSRLQAELQAKNDEYKKKIADKYENIKVT